MVDPAFSAAALNSYQALTTQQTFTLSQALLDRIKAEAERAVAAFPTQAKEEWYSRCTVLLTLFALKRPDIGYHSGMNMILCALLGVFSSDTDVFIMFAHVVEEIYPVNFFTTVDRCLASHVEYRVFAMMAESLRPKVLKALKAVFTQKSQQSQESDFSPFIATMKRLAESWFSTLFSTYLDYERWLRIMDIVLIYGFEGVQRVALGLLSAAEIFFVTAVKQETKALAQGSTVDALLTAGNLARLRLLRRIEKVNIEKLLKKVLNKAKYTTKSRANLLSAATVIEGNYLERLIRLRQTRGLVRKQGEMSVEGLCLTVRNCLGNEDLAREALIRILTQKLNWTAFSALNLYTTLDQRGANLVTYRQFQACLSLLMSENEPRHCLALLFSLVAGGQNFLESSEVIDMLCALESSVDLRSNFFQGQSQGLYTALEAENIVTIDVFLRLALDDSGCQPLLNYIKAVQDEEFVPAGDMRMVERVEEVSFESIHSPIQTGNLTPASDLSEDLFEPVPETDFFPEESIREIGDLTPPIITIQDMDPPKPVESSASRQQAGKRTERQKCARLCGSQDCQVC